MAPDLSPSEITVAADGLIISTYAATQPGATARTLVAQTHIRATSVETTVYDVGLGEDTGNQEARFDLHKAMVLAAMCGQPPTAAARWRAGGGRCWIKGIN